MAKTPNLEYGLTTPMEPVKNYNHNLKRIDADIAARGVHPVQVETEGTTHHLQFAGDFDTVKFTAETDFNPGDTLECNSAELPVLTAEGEAYTVPAWKAGDAVVLTLQPESARVLSPSREKANKGVPKKIPLEFADGISDSEHSGDSYYYLGDDGRVYVHISAKKSTPFARMDYICTLPEGLRPRRVTCMGLVGDNTTMRAVALIGVVKIIFVFSQPQRNLFLAVLYTPIFHLYRLGS